MNTDHNISKILDLLEMLISSPGRSDGYSESVIKEGLDMAVLVSVIELNPVQPGSVKGIRLGTRRGRTGRGG